MDNNLNPNNNLEQNNNTSNVTPNVDGSNNNENVSSTETINDKILFGNKEEKNTPVIMSRKMSEELEAKKRQEKANMEQYVPVPVSKAKYVAMIVFFIFMFALVYFLPDISSFVSLKKAEKEQQNTPTITTGLLTCKLSRTTDIFNIEYTGQFSFEDSKLNKLTYITSTKGDSVIDAESLDFIITKCNKLQDQVSGLGGVHVTCDQSGGTITEKQVLDYNTLDAEIATAAYVEAGGIYPEFKKSQDIDQIERNMHASGYTCERTAE